MLSNESLLFALNSGCLNSQACECQGSRLQTLWRSAYTGSVRRMPRLFVIVSHLVEIVLVKLSNEAGEIAMLEVFGKDRLGESFILHDV